MAKFKNYLIADIWFEREDRQRKSLGDLSDLKESIAAVGLLQPVIITKQGQLIAGERRLQSCTDLGMSHIHVHFLEDCTPNQLIKIELDENIKRLALPWRDRCMAIQQYHDICKVEDNTWTQERTAESMGFEVSHINKNLKVAEAIESGNEMVLSAPEFSTAINIVERANSRAAASEQELIEALTESDEDETVEEVKEKLSEKKKKIPVINADFHTWATKYSGPKFNFIHCDFPYGIDAGKHDQGAGKEFKTYDDSEDVYWKLLATLHEAMDNVVADSAHLMFWFSPTFYIATFERLELMGWKVNPHPLIWHRSNNQGILPDPQRGGRQVYEMAFMASRGDRLIVRAKSNLCPAPNIKIIHMSEKPVLPLEHFLQMFVDKSTSMLDPTAGSCNALRVAKEMGAGKVFGLEKDKEIFNLAKDAWDV